MALWNDQLMTETQVKARKELNENPRTLLSNIQEVRDLIVTRPDINFTRTDDDFIRRFLRARKYDIVEAFKVYARYFEYRQHNKLMFTNFSTSDPEIRQALIDGFPSVLENHDHFGRKILILNAANWETWRYPYVHILRALLLSLEYLIQDQEIQVHGFVIIIDWTAFTFKQAARLSPALMKLTIEGLQDCFPARYAGIHFVNQPWYVEAAFTICRPFLKQTTKEKIFLHGNNLTTLHHHIHKEILPTELAGLMPAYNIERFAREIIESGFELTFGGGTVPYDRTAQTGAMNRSLSVPLPNENYDDTNNQDKEGCNMDFLLKFD
ncbi:clavesin-2-like [Saccoglossus kowalevskii]|uniref:Clavesin-2-like n=1 Tax=Saccoglossus kowalevskii TaxID=10224 RepID=A0ABM0MR74_SACKO|nr:PREDICTED: clavesin-2-like [Saccoglossus kowalevskii]